MDDPNQHVFFSTADTPLGRTLNRSLGTLFGAYLRAFFRLMPFFARMGVVGIGVAFLFMIGSLGLFVLLLLGLMILMSQASVTAVGQLGILVFVMLAALSVVWVWVGEQTRTRGGLIRLVVLAMGLALLVWLVWNSGFFSEARLAYMRSAYRENPVRYISVLFLTIVALVVSVIGFARGTQRFVRNAWRSPLHFVWAVVRLSALVLVVCGIVWVVMFSGYVDWRPVLDQVLDSARLRE